MVLPEAVTVGNNELLADIWAVLDPEAQLVAVAVMLADADTVLNPLIL